MQGVLPPNMWPQQWRQGDDRSDQNTAATSATPATSWGRMARGRGRFFDLPGLASFINLLFSTSQSRTGRAVFTVGQSREKRAFGRGDW